MPRNHSRTRPMHRQNRQKHRSELEGQTAFETAGIPTPTDQEDAAATEKLHELTEAIMDRLERDWFGTDADPQ